MKDNFNQKYIYIILSKTNNKMGEFIRFMTHFEYNHVSISLNDNFNNLYSFARYYKSAPLVGGFINESILRYKSSNANLKIFKIPVTSKQYNDIYFYIEKVKLCEKKYIYNTLSAMASFFHADIKIRNSFTCIGFINYILKNFEVLDFNQKEVRTIKSLNQRLKYFEYYEGNINHLKVENDWGADLYLNKKGIIATFVLTLCNFTKLLYRFII